MDSVKSKIKQTNISRWIIIGLLCCLGVFAGKIYLISWQYYSALLLFSVLIFFMLFLRKIELIILIFILVLVNTETLQYIFPARFLWINVFYLIIAWLIGKILNKNKFTDFGNMDNSLIIFFSLFWFWVFFIVIIKINELHYLSWLSSIIHIWVCILIFYIFYDFLSQDEVNLKQFMFILNFIIVFVSVRIIFTVIFKIINNEIIYKNIKAGFGNPNAVGFFLMLLFPIIIEQHISNGLTRKRSILLYLLMGAALYFSYSRTSMFCFIIAMLYLFRKNKKLSIIMMVVLAVGLFFFLFEYIFLHKSTLWLTANKIIEERVSAYRFGWSIFLDYPFFGIGYGRYSAHLPNERFYNCHSVYLSILYQLGIIGFLIFIVLHAVIFIDFAKISFFAKNRFFKAIASGCTASFLALLLHGFTEDIGLLIPHSLSAINFFNYILLSIPFAIKNLQLKELKQ